MTGFISRGFKGLRRPPEEFKDRLPPGQYYEPGFPVLTAGPTPHVPLNEWGLQIDGMVAETARVDLGGVRRAAPRRSALRHPLRDQVVEARHELRRRFGGHLLEAAEPLDAFVMAVLLRRLHDEPAARGHHRTARRGS